jgi:Ni,Fe-hydrogenase III large subunit
VETALGLQIPPRAHFIRTLLAEVERMHSNLLNVGLACHFVGFDTGFMQIFRVREKAMTMAELLTGGRKTYAINLVGGVRRDVLKDERIRTLQLVAELRQEVTTLTDILMSTPNWESRTKDACDRVTMVDVRKDKATTVPYRELERYCREQTGSPLR